MPMQPQIDRVIYFGLVLAVLVSALCTSIVLARRVSVSFEPGDYSSYRCNTGSALAEQNFTILTLTSQDAVGVADRLCSSPEMAQHFASVTILWRLRRFLTSRHIVEEDYDLFWTRRHLVAGMVPDADDLYLPILDTQHYAVYWLSNQPQMQLSPDYLAGKRLGFLQDNVSQTFFLQPFRSLREADIDLEKSQKYFYPDMSTLFEAFYAGAVDIIPSYDPYLGIEQGVNRSRLLISDNVPSGSWFLRRHWEGSGIECELLAALTLSAIFKDFAMDSASAADCREAP